VRFTALLHHVTVDRLRESYRAISPNAAPGIDGVTWREYGLAIGRTAIGSARSAPADPTPTPQAGDEQGRDRRGMSDLLPSLDGSRDAVSERP